MIAVGALIGALDCVFGNRLKLGDKFEEGFLCMGPTALSMVGIICLAPLLGQVCQVAVSPVFRLFSIDPAMFGCILANNMGGYPLAMSMADNQMLGLYSGLIVSSTLGATLVYTIPVALGLIAREKRYDFAMGIMIDVYKRQCLSSPKSGEYGRELFCMLSGTRSGRRRGFPVRPAAT